MPCPRTLRAALGALLPALLVTPALAAGGGEYYPWKVSNYAIDSPLGGLQGDAKRGRALAIDRKKGNCLACHHMPIPEQDFHGTIAPPLVGVASRYSEGQLRLRLVDIKQINPMSLMPSFYKSPSKLHRVAKAYRGKTVLTAQEVEDVLAYMKTLK